MDEHMPESERWRWSGQSGIVERYGLYNYKSAWGQILLTSLVGFCCPGMLNALNGMGGGGNVDPTVAAHASAALMATGALAYIVLCIPIFEIYGVRSMALGCWTYPLYAAALLYYSISDEGSWVVASGVALGIGSSFFWLVQGAIMISYPTAEQKGRAIATFWIIFNSGGMIGALIAFAQTRSSSEEESGTISKGTYAIFILLMILGEALAFGLVSPSEVSRTDSAKVELAGKGEQPRFADFGTVIKRELLYLLAIRHEKRIMLLLPMFFAANWFYSYQQNVMNGQSFDLSGRTFNSALYWAAQIIGGFLIGAILDLPPFSTRTRAILAWTLLFIFGNLIMVAGSHFEATRQAHPRGWVEFGWNADYIGGATLYLAYGMLDALWQGLCYWLLGAMCSTPDAASKLVAIYKITQAVGAAIAYQMTTIGVSGSIQFASNWMLIFGGLVIALPAILGIREDEVGQVVEATEQSGAYMPLADGPRSYESIP